MGRDQSLNSEPLLRRIADAIFGYDFFISYAHRDGTYYPTQLKSRLSELGFTVFLDLSEYVAGSDLRRETGRHVGKSSRVVIVGRPEALKSEWVRREVQHALRKNNVPIFININRTAELFGRETEVARLILQDHWLRIDETLPEPDAAPSDRTIAELARSFKSTKQQSKRQRLLAIVAGCFALISGVALWQWRVADRSLEAAVSTGDLVVHRLAQNLRRQDGIRESAIVDILEKANQLSERLSEIAPDRPDLLRNRSAVLSEMAKTFLFFGLSDIALADAVKAEAIYSTLASGTNSVSTRYNLARARILLGDVRLERSELNLARAIYESAEKLISPDQLTESVELRAQVSERLGSVLLAGGDVESARERFSQCIELREALIKSGLDRGANGLGKSICLERLGDAYIAQNQAQALGRYRESREVLEALLNAGDNNPDVRRGIASSYHKAGDAYRKMNQLALAEESYRRDFDLTTSIFNDDPDRADRRHDLLLSVERLGDIYSDQEEKAEAEVQFRKAVELSNWLRNRDPERRVWLSEAVRLRHKEIVQLESRDWDECLRLADERLAIAKSAHGRLASDEFDLVALLNDVAWYALMAKQPARTLSASDEAIQAAPNRLESNLNRAHALMLLGSIDEARRLYISHKEETFRLQGKPRAWRVAVVDDFSALRAAGVVAPLMNEIEEDFRK